MIDKVKGERVGVDVNPYVVALLNAVRDGWDPPQDVSEDFYNEVKNNRENYDPALVGFVGFGCSFGGKFFGGYARHSEKSRNCAAEAFRNLAKQRPNLQDAYFYSGDYQSVEIIIPANSFIYCDPPYAKTAKYATYFDSVAFWVWAKSMSAKGHTVAVSEYSAPDDVLCVGERTRRKHGQPQRRKAKKGRAFIYSLKLFSFFL